MDFAEEVKVVIKRVPILIGKEGEIKARIEEEVGCKLDISSEDGVVLISSDDGLKLMIAKNIVLAISRGFNPEVALKLTNLDYMYESIDISSYATSKNALIRLKGRLIGQDGQSRKKIEKYTNSDLVIFGKTVSIIAKIEDIVDCRRAIEMILTGAEHNTVFRWLEKNAKQKVMKNMLGTHKIFD